MRHNDFVIAGVTSSTPATQGIRSLGMATLVLTCLISSSFLSQVFAQARTPDVGARIQQDGQLAGAVAYRSLVTAKYGRARVQRANRIAVKASAGNVVKQVGKQPAGFGQTFVWDRKDDEILLVVFVNAANYLGVSIEGVAKNDLVRITSASGIASFAEDTGNPGAFGFVGLLATGAKAAAGLAGVPEAIPAISKVEGFAKNQFKATNVKTKRRDAFGVDPGSGHRAREEGGLLICLPESGGPYYSGDGDHKNRWIKPDGTRIDVNLPEHIKRGSAFFANREDRNTRRAATGGQLYVVPWDWKFEDNAGYYKAFIYIKKAPRSETTDISSRQP